MRRRWDRDGRMIQPKRRWGWKKRRGGIHRNERRWGKEVDVREEGTEGGKKRTKQARDSDQKRVISVRWHIRGVQDRRSDVSAFPLRPLPPLLPARLLTAKSVLHFKAFRIKSWISPFWMFYFSLPFSCGHVNIVTAHPWETANLVSLCVPAGIWAKCSSLPCGQKCEKGAVLQE